MVEIGALRGLKLGFEGRVVLFAPSAAIRNREERRGSSFRGQMRLISSVAFPIH